MVFLNFFAIFFEISITRRIGTKRNDNFYFLSFSAFSNQFWLEMKHNGIFLFFYFFAIFLEFSISRRVGRNGMIIFIFPLSRPFPTFYGLKISHSGVF